MIMRNGTYSNIFTPNGKKDVYLIFPEYMDSEECEKIAYSVEEFMNNTSEINKDTIENFINNNCDNYDVEVIMKKDSNPVMYNAICYMVEHGMTREATENYLGTTAEEIFELCGFDFNEPREYEFDIKTTMKIVCKGGVEEARRILECNLEDVGALDIESYCVDEFGREVSENE